MNSDDGPTTKDPICFCVIRHHEVASCQSQKTQSFCLADFATLSDERRSRSKIFLLFNMDERTLLRSKVLEIFASYHGNILYYCNDAL